MILFWRKNRWPFYGSEPADTFPIKYDPIKIVIWISCTLGTLACLFLKCVFNNVQQLKITVTILIVRMIRIFNKNSLVSRLFANISEFLLCCCFDRFVTATSLEDMMTVIRQRASCVRMYWYQSYFNMLFLWDFSLGKGCLITY